MKRRHFMAAPLALLAWPAFAQDYPAAKAGTRLQFPRDHGSHPAFRTEWWYITGWLTDEAGKEFGVQVTFFRNRPGIAEASKSRFAPTQLVFAHAALADATSGRLVHDQRAARAGLGLAEAREDDTAVWVDDWSLRRESGAYAARVRARGFGFELSFKPTQALLLQGEAGYSRKGPLPVQASFYYSQPQLAVAGSVTRGGKASKVTGTAWLDHEWSSEAMAEGASGWDWCGINLADGGALMAFRMRGKDGTVLWAGGSLRRADGSLKVFAPGEVTFMPQRTWRSAASGATYPVGMRVKAGEIDIELEPLMDDQELDSRASTGTIYWEGAVRAKRGGVDVGRGYLELTGYWRALRI